MTVSTHLIEARATRDAKAIDVAEGKTPMTSLGVAADMTGYGGQKKTRFYEVLAFGPLAEYALGIKTDAVVNVLGVETIEDQVKSDGTVVDRNKIVASVIVCVLKPQQ